jgi:hypothetical protein
MRTKESFADSICKEQMQMAEREFSAFISAVKELRGPEQARLSAVDWLDESESMDSQPGSTSRDWRAVTIAASARLANRLNAGPHDRSFAEHVDYEGIDDTSDCSLGLGVAAHGARKLFGWFGGGGISRTGAFFQSIGFRAGWSICPNRSKCWRLLEQTKMTVRTEEFSGY